MLIKNRKLSSHEIKVCQAARKPIFGLESDGVFSRLSVNAPEFGPLSQVPPRLNAITVGEPDEKSELRMPTRVNCHYHMFSIMLSASRLYDKKKQTYRLYVTSCT